MKTSFLVSCTLFLVTISSFAQPLWLDFEQRKAAYPDAEYFTGFGIAKLEKGESEEDNLNTAKSFALQDLTESVRVTVESASVHELSEVNRQFSESYKQAVTSFSSVTLPGIQTQTWFNRKTKTACAFSWVSKRELSSFYQEMLKQEAEKLSRKLEEAGRYNAISEKQKALETYQACFPILRQMEEAVMMLITIGINPEGKLPGAFEKEITSSIASISRDDDLTIDELCQLMAGSLSSQLGSEERTIRLAPFTYQDSRMGSELSAQLGILFESKLVREGLKIASEGTTGIQHPLMLSGSYWEDGKYLKFIASVKEVSSGRTLASVENRIPVKQLAEARISWKPENFEDAMARLRIFTEGQIVDGGLILDVWTDKGAENLLFRDGETMKLYVKVNQASHLRFIYYFADQTRTLLVPGDYYIDSSLVNRIVEIPIDFICAEPFGVETLQVIAQTYPLTPLSSYEKDGYFFVREDLETIMKQVRGFKRSNDQQLFAEKFLVITTIPE